MEGGTSVTVYDGMEQILIDFGDICRFCLSETKNNISIYDKCSSECTMENNEPSIFDIVTKVTSIKMNNIDGFPSLVCENCFNIVKMCLDFQQSCILSERYLNDCYIKTLEEARAKISLNTIKVKDETAEHNIKNLIDSQMLQNEGVKHELYLGDSEDCVGDVKQYTSMVNNYFEANEHNEELKMKSQRKTELCKKGVLSVLKAENIKQKYQRINSLSERLKEAQSKLAEDILRTTDIISTSVKVEEPTNKSFKKFSCPQCLLTFPTPDLLMHHLTSHITDRKNNGTINIFECKFCKKEFSFMYHLMKHYKSAHKIPMSKLSEESLTPKHIQNSAESEKNYQCLDCVPPKIFNKRKNLLQHLTDHAKVESSLSGSLMSDQFVSGEFYMCTLCDIKPTFSTKFSLNQHLINVHEIKQDDITSASDPAVMALRSEVSIEQEPFKRKAITEMDSIKLKLMKIHICLDCSPATSFADVTDFVEHKADCHKKKFECLSVKELTPVYVQSVNILKRGPDDGGRTFKVMCKSCDNPSEFLSTADFVQHMKVHHKDVPKEKWDVETKYLSDSFTALKRQDRVWKCTECPASYMRKHSLHHHLKEKHNKVRRLGAIKCPELGCDASFFTNRQVIQHGITVHEKYYADIHKVFKDKILDGPMKSDKRVRNFECDICQKKYLGKTSLKRHILRTHLGKSDIENAICSYCGKTFSNNLNLKSHIDFVHEALFVSCPICKKNVNFKTIGKHYKIHQANTEFQKGAKNRYLCNQCGRVLKSKSGFDGHQKLHQNVRDQICDICGNGFTTKKNLYIHKRGHNVTHKKMFECDQCDKVFSGKHTLNRHLLTHSGEKNFVCEICSKCFYTLQELNRHTRYHKKEYRFNCQLCDMRFLDRSRFRHHMMRHRNIRPHKCHFCDKVFIIRQKMNLHMAARHNVEVQTTKAVWKDPKTYIPLDDLL